MHFGTCQFDYLAEYAYYAPKMSFKKHCFYTFTNNPSYVPLTLAGLKTAETSSCSKVLTVHHTTNTFYSKLSALH